MPLSRHLLNRLNDALMRLDIKEGFRILKRSEKLIETLAPDDPLAISFLLCVMQWIDRGYGELSLAEAPLRRFTALDHGDMKLSDYVQLRTAEAFHAFASEDASTAVTIFETVLGILPRVAGDHSIALAHFWIARAHRKKGEYEQALHHIEEAKRFAKLIHADKFIAEVQVHESWLLFQKGQRKEAFHLLDEAEAELRPTGHALVLGNIESARGRFVRRMGEYVKALESFDRAITIYSIHFPNHPNLARALVNAAYVKRLMALDLSHRSSVRKARGDYHARFLDLCRDALAMLQKAAVIYAHHHQEAGVGSVFVNAGHLHLDCGDIECASTEAVKAFRLGEKKSDSILMARARILQADIENAKAEEQIGDMPDVAAHANLAVQAAEEAIALAKSTQNKRLLAGAYIARGLTAANDFFADWDTAKTFVSLADELLSTNDRDHLFKDMRALKARILQATGIEQSLRCWSDGLTGDKTFQQITEEFAEIVIPKVWVREGRNISKVTKKLAISPKKVRRILRNTQMLEE